MRLVTLFAQQTCTACERGQNVAALGGSSVATLRCDLLLCKHGEQKVSLSLGLWTHGMRERFSPR